MTTIGVFAVICNAQGRVLCVKRDYGPRNWSLPGGRLEANESPIVGLEREVLEETGYRVQVGRLVGVYSLPSNDDIVLCFTAEIVGQDAWQPDGEITECSFFPGDALPQPMSPRAVCRVQDALAGVTGIVRVFERDENER